MRKSVGELYEGCILKEDIMGKTESPIIPAGTVLTERHLEIMKVFFIREAVVARGIEESEKKPEKQEKMNEPKKEESRKEVLPQLSTARSSGEFSHSYMKAVKQYKAEFDKWQSGMAVDVTAARAIVIPLIEQAERDRSILRGIHQYVQREDYIYHHAVAVGVTSSLLAKGLELEKGACTQAALAGILADCGMAKLPSQLLKKESSLTEAEFKSMRAHPVLGLQMIKDATLMKPEAKLAVLQHHERLDGTGYPSGEAAGKLPLMSRIVAVADVYHALVSDKMYRNRITPFKALDILKEDSFGKYDIAVIRALNGLIADLPLGSQVMLSNGEQAEILFTNPESSTRPLVKLMSSGEMLDLKTNRKIYIYEVLKELL